MKYKSYRIVGNKPRWVVVDNNGKILNNNPLKEELKNLENAPYVRNIVTRVIHYNKTNTCDRCKENNKETKLVPTKTYKEYDDGGNWTNRWLCQNCWHNDYNKKPGSYQYMMKSLGDRRIGNQDQNHTNVIGDNFEKLSEIVFSATNLNKTNDNFNYPIDHLNNELGYFQTKGCTYNSTERCWRQHFASLHNAINNGFDFRFLIIYCTNKERNIIERTYKIPKEECLKRKSIGIYKNPTNNVSHPIVPWYERYRIKDEDLIKKINDTWKHIIEQ